MSVDNINDFDRLAPIITEAEQYVAEHLAAGTAYDTARISHVTVHAGQPHAGYAAGTAGSYVPPALNSELLSLYADNAGRLEPTFTEKLIRHIDKRNLKDTDVYKAAQIDRKLFSKIVSNRDYQPSKDTALAFVFALGLDLQEANDMLSSAGYTLSHSSERDVLIEFLIVERLSNLADINYILNYRHQKVIGRA